MQKSGVKKVYRDTDYPVTGIGAQTRKGSYYEDADKMSDYLFIITPSTHAGFQM